MSRMTAIQLYEALRNARSDEERARIIAEAIEQLEQRFPQLADVATNASMREAELRLQREIEATRLEIKRVEKELRKEIEDTRLEVKRIEVELHKALNRHTLLIITAIGVFAAAIRWIGGG